MAPEVSSVSLRFSGLVLRFRFPEPLPLPPAFEALRCADPGYADEEITLRLLRQPLQPCGDPVRVPGYQVYQIPEGRLYIFSQLIAEDGCQVAFLLCPDGRHTLFYPASRWDFYSRPLNCRSLICGEQLLARHRAFLLHSSVVLVQDRILLFSGPSGVGKSTQARLWQDCLGARIINGDRCLIREKDGVFYGGGSLWCGTSDIWRPEYAPIAGILLLGQSPENRLTPAGREAFPFLYRQCTLNSWDGAFMAQLTDLLLRLIGSVPVCRLDCRPDESAVRLVYDTLLKKEVSPCPPKAPPISGPF